MTEVAKLSILLIILYFVGYILFHMMIIISYNREQEKLQKNLDDKKIESKVIILKILSKWFPAIYVVFILLSLYL